MNQLKSKPIILTEGNYTKKDLDDLKKHNIWKIADVYTSQLTEVFETTNAHLINKNDYKQKLEAFLKEKTSPDPELAGNYVYFPWSGLLLHMLPEKDLQTLRLNRTRLLVTPEEQLKLSAFNAAVAGLSFGNGIALSLVYGGASNTIKIADSDIFETTNLNRVRVGLHNVGAPKTHVTAQQIYEINPYANVQLFENGVDVSTIEDFVHGDPKTNIIFDVVDDLSMKVRLRLEAKKAKIPVVMLTSLEDSVLVDVERYDIHPDAELFHGLLGPLPEELLNKQLTEQEKAQYAMAIVGKDSVSFRNLQSLSEIGRTLVSRPHLFSTVSIVCGLAGYILKRIALGEDMPSMRKLVAFNEVMEILPNKNDTPQARNEIFSKMMGNS